MCVIVHTNAYVVCLFMRMRVGPSFHILYKNHTITVFINICFAFQQMISTNIWRKFIELTLNMFFFHERPVGVQHDGHFMTCQFDNHVWFVDSFPIKFLHRFGPHICNTMGQSLHLANTITQQPPDRFIRQIFLFCSTADIQRHSELPIGLSDGPGPTDHTSH